jgi:23S rRNA (pseudouridine1915-N3)-methyltransferase
MKILIVAVGKISDRNPEHVIISEYLKRTPWRIEVKELDDVGDQKKTSEKILNAIPKGYVPVMLDKGGKNYSSEEFASYLEKVAMNSPGKLAFLIGASDGFHENVYAATRCAISFGKMTYPHKLSRIILVEQIYRAWAITTGHPYHK